MIVYMYSKCSTCKKALEFLKTHLNPSSFTLKEIKDTPPSMEELKAMLKFAKGNIKKLFNSSGILYREMQLSDKLENFSEKEALELLHKNGMLVKRPFVIGQGFGLLGFSEKEWAEKIDASSLK